MSKMWWKILALVLILYSIIGAFLFPAPDDLGILRQTVRNLHFHVPMWFGMISVLTGSFVFSLRFLRTNNLKNDLLASSMIQVALFFGFMGILTGSVWARFTWTAWWTPDPKLNGAAIGVLMYIAYYILRSSLKENEIRMRKLSAVYNVLAFPIFITLILIIPKITNYSLHPGSGDTVGFSSYDLNNNLRKVFYPAVLGWILMGFWLVKIIYRLQLLTDEKVA